MRRYYLHIADGDQFYEDRQGFEAADALQARYQALIVARELLNEGLWHAEMPGGRYVSVVDEHGRSLDTVSLWQVLELDGGFGDGSTADQDSK